MPPLGAGDAPEEEADASVAETSSFTAPSPSSTANSLGLLQYFPLWAWDGEGAALGGEAELALFPGPPPQSPESAMTGRSAATGLVHLELGREAGLHADRAPREQSPQRPRAASPPWPPQWAGSPWTSAQSAGGTPRPGAGLRGGSSRASLVSEEAHASTVLSSMASLGAAEVAAAIGDGFSADDDDAAESHARLARELVGRSGGEPQQTPEARRAAPRPASQHSTRSQANASTVLTSVISELVDVDDDVSDLSIERDGWIADRVSQVLPQSQAGVVERTSSAPSSPSGTQVDSVFSRVVDDSSMHFEEDFDVPQLDFDQLLALGSPAERAHLSSEEARGLPRVRFEAPERQKCSICLEVFRHGMLLTGLACGHVFHVDCLSQWVQRSAQCPNCRAPVEPCGGHGVRPSTPLLVRGRSAGRGRPG